MGVTRKQSPNTVDILDIKTSLIIFEHVKLEKSIVSDSFVHKDIYVMRSSAFLWAVPPIVNSYTGK